MFKKVLIAEDHEVRNLGVVNTLTELQIQNYDFVNYCDEALQKIKTAVTNNSSYDLLITDLSFDKDHIEQKINSGQKLIEEVKKIQPNLKIIAFSIEKKPKIIDDLFKVHNINGFVSKGRNDGKDLRSTIKKVFSGETVIPQEILNSIRTLPSSLQNMMLPLLNFLPKDGSKVKLNNILKKIK